MIKSRGRKHLVILWMAGDIIIMEIALFLAYFIRISSGLMLFRGPHDFLGYALLSLSAAVIWPIVFVFLGLYNPNYLLEGSQEYSKVLLACTFGALLLSVSVFWTRSILASRGWLLLAWLLSTVFISLWRFAVRRIVRRLRQRGRFISKAIIVGTGDEAVALAEQFNTSACSGIKVVGFADDYLRTGTKVYKDLKVLGTPAMLESIIKKTGASDAIVIPRALAWESYRDIMQSVFINQNGFDVKISPGIYEMATTGVRIIQEGFVPLMMVDRVRVTGIHKWLKVIMDYTLAILLLVALAPFIIAITLILKFRSSSSIVKSDGVLTYRGAQFKSYSFRCSPIESKHDGGLTGRLENWLYATGLNKLPQLVNVLQGKMSLIGPRTISVMEKDKYGSWLPSLLTVKPGMTGPWVVGGGKSLSLEEEMRLNMYYIRNHTIWLDLSILAQTISFVLTAQRDKIRARWVQGADVRN